MKTVQIDGSVFDVLADVKKKYNNDGGFIYTLRLVENKNVKAFPKQGGQAPLKSSDNALTKDIVPQPEQKVNTSDEDSRSSLATSESRIARLKEDKEFLKRQMEKSRSVALSPADVDKIVKEMRDQFGFDNSERDNVKKMPELILISILVFFCTI